MVRLVRPLFSDEAHGRVAEIGVYRRGKRGPELMRLSEGPTGRVTEAQDRIRGCFRVARGAWMRIEPSMHWWNGKYQLMRWPRWPDFWRQWLSEHPECSS